MYVSLFLSGTKSDIIGKPDSESAFRSFPIMSGGASELRATNNLTLLT